MDLMQNALIPIRWKVVRCGKTVGYVGKSKGTYHYEWGSRREGFYPTLVEATDALVERRVMGGT